MAFADVLGHDRVKDLLSRGLREKRLAHSLLFCGPDGVGKKRLALAAARALLCERQDGESCGSCSPCRRALRGLHPDVSLVQPATANIKIDQIRDVVRDVVARPFEARARAFVIDDAHAMTEEASNALLKSLEEPPPTSHVFLVSSSPQSLLPTIRSRCQTLRMGPLPLALLEQHLRDARGLPPEEARLRALLSAGSLGAALAFESDAYRALRDELLALLERIERMSPVDRLEAAEKLNELDDCELAMTALRSLLRDVAALASGSEALLNVDVVDRLRALAHAGIGRRAVELGGAVGQVREDLQASLNTLLSMDVLLDRLAG
jgi:DNA polymerase-3 subunit delta'